MIWSMATGHVTPIVGTVHTKHGTQTEQVISRSAISTSVTRSSAVTCASPLQSPTQVLEGVYVGYGLCATSVAVGIGVTAFAAATSEANGASKAAARIHRDIVGQYAVLSEARV